VAAALRINNGNSLRRWHWLHDQSAIRPLATRGERKLDEFDARPTAERVRPQTLPRACASWNTSKHRYIEFDGLNLTFEVREGIVEAFKRLPPASAASGVVRVSASSFGRPSNRSSSDWVDEKPSRRHKKNWSGAFGSRRGENRSDC